MKIVRVDITAFGKLKNITFNFDDGVNILQQQNGFGKSTLCAFVRAMLYGLGYNYKTVDGIKANDVTKYMPWDATGKFGGSIQIAHQGKNYRIERFFGATARSESLTVVDLDTGKQQDIACPGEYFLGLTVESYDRCTYLPQEQVELASNQNFDAKLANLVQDSTLDYDKLQEKLRGYKKTLKYERGFGGEIPTLENEIVQLKHQLQNAQNNASDRKRMAEQLVVVDNQLNQTAQQIDTLTQTIEQLQQELYDATPSQADVELAKRIDDLQLQIASVPQTITEDYAQFGNLLEQQKVVQQKLTPLATRRTLFAIGLGLATILAIVLALLEKYIFAGIGALLAVVFAILTFTQSGKNITQQLAELQKQLDQIVARYINPNGKQFDIVCNEFWQYFSNYQTNVAVLKALGPKPVIQNNQAKITTQLQQTRVRLQGLTEQQQQLIKTQHQLQFALAQPAPSIVDIADQLFAKTQQLQVAKHKYEVATQTGELLAQAKESLSSAYIPELCTRTQKLLNDVTNGNYQVVTDRTFAISLQENGQTKPLVAFSRGIREITLLCFRIALAQLIYGKDIPLLIVDDAFVNFDEQNFVRATTLLKQLSTTTQVIYFTCHDRTGNL